MPKLRSNTYPVLIPGFHHWWSNKKGKYILFLTSMDRAQSTKRSWPLAFSEEDRALSKNINEEKKFTMQWPFGSVNKNRLNFYRLCHMESQRSWCSSPFSFRNLMNCFGPDFVLLHKAVSYFPHEITSNGETHCPLVQMCVGQILHPVPQPDLVRKLNILFEKKKKKSTKRD